MTEKENIDKILRNVGSKGPYQIIQYGFIMLCQLSIAFSSLVYVFIGYSPAHQCRELSRPIWSYEKTSFIPLSNTSTASLEYGKCNIGIVVNKDNITSVLDTVPCLDGNDFNISSDRTIVTEWDLVCDNEGLAELTQTLITVGQMIGATFLTSLSDRFGRKPVLVSTHILMLITTVILGLIPSYIGFAVIRVIIGIIQEGLGLVCSCLSIEIFPKEYRGAITAIGTIWWAVCVTLLTPFGYLLRDYTWRYTAIATALVALPSLLSYWIMDESLRWLVANNKMATAEKVIKRAAKWNKKDDSKPLELLEKVKQNMADDQQEDENISSRVNRDFIKVDSGEVSDSSSVQRYTILDLFRNRYLIKLSCIIWYTWCVNSLTYYGLFLTSSTFAGDRFLNYFLSCLVELPSAFVFWSIINRIGRKKTSIFFHGVAGTSLIISVVLLLVKDSSGATSTASTVFSLIGKFAVTGSWTTIYLSTPELYPTNLRNAAFGMASAAARIGGMIAPYSSLLASRIQWGPGVVFGSCCVIVTFLTLFLPETRKEELPRSLNDVVVMCKRKGKNKA